MAADVRALFYTLSPRMSRKFRSPFRAPTLAGSGGP